MAITMFFGAVIAVLVAYTRAIGQPKIVTQAVFLQLIVFSVLAPLLMWKLGSVGMATASACALASATCAFIIKIGKGKR
jgi:Na+-driven multidrug efflux pump